MVTERNDWVTRIADDLVRKFGEDERIILASGVSPSGHIHLGNLREILTTHFVYSELVLRGVPAEHILSWDDFDRFRKVPQGVEGVDETWSQYIGRPYSDIPAPHGSEYSSWAEHFKAELRESLHDLNVDLREISQTQMYRSGAYQDSIITAMNSRIRIAEILREFQTKGEQLDVSSYYPYKPFCEVCGTDFTQVSSYNDETYDMTYSCRCGHTNQVNLRTFNNGKLVWKVDWTMRWAFEGVNFEAAGVDHRSPGSSWDAGRLIAPIFNAERPEGVGYSFVGVEGAAKISSSVGNVPTPSQALRIMTPSMLRWMYARRKPSQSFTIDFGASHSKLFDEWDSLNRKVNDGRGKIGDVTVIARSNYGVHDADEVVIPFKTIVSTVDITGGNESELLRILNDSGFVVPDIDSIRQRLNLASYWLEHYVPEEDRTQVRSTANVDMLNELSDEHRAMISIVLEQMDDRFNLSELTKLVFGAPKVFYGFDEMEKNLPPEVKQQQQAFFITLYRLLTDSDSGPRIPSLFLCIGKEKVRNLLTK